MIEQEQVDNLLESKIKEQLKDIKNKDKEKYLISLKDEYEKKIQEIDNLISLLQAKISHKQKFLFKMKNINIEKIENIENIDEFLNIEIKSEQDLNDKIYIKLFDALDFLNI